MAGLRLIMAVSKDGVVSLGPDDDMLWTGSDDKRAFRLLTSVGGVLGAGRCTYFDLPTLKGRKVVCLSTRRLRVPNQTMLDFERHLSPVTSTPELALPPNASYGESMTLDEFARKYPDGWLIGGQTVAMAALRKGLVGEAFLCRAPIELRPFYDFRNGRRDEMTPWLSYDSRWAITDTVRMGKTSVDVWRRK